MIALSFLRLVACDYSLLDQAGLFGHYEAVIQAVDAAVIGHVSGLGKSADILIDVGRFVELSAPVEGQTADGDAARELITYMFADMTLVLGVSFSALMVLYTVASEKEAKLLAALRTVGLREWLFWTSWMLSYFVLGVVGAAVRVLFLSFFCDL